MCAQTPLGEPCAGFGWFIILQQSLLFFSTVLCPDGGDHVKTDTVVPLD